MESQHDKESPDILQPLMKNPAQKIPWQRFLPVILAICAGMVLSLLSFSIMSRAAQQQAQARFALDAQIRVNAIKREIDSHFEIVRSLRRLFLSSHEVTRKEFSKYASSALKSHPDIHALTWLPRVSRETREIYEEAAREEGFSRFLITEREEQGAQVAAGARQEYYPAYYVEPYAGNEALLGFDLASEPLHREALNRARDSGAMTVSPSFPLVEETGPGQGIIVFVPMYRQGEQMESVQARQEYIVGFVSGLFRVRDIVEHSYEYLPQRGIAISIVDESGSPDSGLIYASSREEVDIPGWQRRYALNVGNRVWKIIAKPTARYSLGMKDWYPRGAAAAILLITGILAVYLKNNIRHTLHVETLINDLDRTVTEQKKTEQELQEAQDQYEALISNIPGVTWISDRDGQTVFISPNIERVYGYTQQEIYSKGENVWFGRIHPDDSRRVKDAYRSLFDKGTPFNVEYRIQRKDGQWIWILDTAIKTYRKENYQFAYGVFSDISERKKMDDLLRESEERYRLLFENSPLGIVHFTERGDITDCNEKLQEIIGASREKTIGINVLRDLRDNRIIKAVQAALSGRTGYYEGDYLSVISGKRTPIKAHFAPVISGDGPIVGGIGVFEDITERRGLEEQLLQSQKMEAVGQLAGGIAHDFNNIITAIISYAYLVRKKMQGNDSLVSNVDRILSLSEKASQITQGLLTFSRQQYFEFMPVSLNTIIRRIHHLFTQLIGEHIEVRTELTAGDTTIMADRVQIEQVILNLATNARDAMPGGGTLLIRTMRAGIDEGFIPPDGTEVGQDYVLLAISDTGIGIREDMKQRIFEPFFTTKDVGKGTGLGLAVTYGIVRQHSGLIRVSDGPDGGTRFMIYLPLSETPAVEEVPPADHEVGGSMETILLAEDEPLVRNSLKAILEESGYRVIEAVNGEDALEKFREHRDEIALAILDVVMPKINGRQACEKIRAARQDLKVVFISGYTSDFLMEGEVVDDNTAYIAKPVIPAILLGKMKTLIGEAAT